MVGRSNVGVDDSGERLLASRYVDVHFDGKSGRDSRNAIASAQVRGVHADCEGTHLAGRRWLPLQPVDRARHPDRIVDPMRLAEHRGIVAQPSRMMRRTFVRRDEDRQWRHRKRRNIGELRQGD